MILGVLNPDTIRVSMSLLSLPNTLSRTSGRHTRDIGVGTDSSVILSRVYFSRSVHAFGVPTTTSIGPGTVSSSPSTFPSVSSR